MVGFPKNREIFNATVYGPACLQGRADGGNGTSLQSEDCLRINIIAPAGARNLPVYIYSHGGGFDSGASSDPKIDGSYLAAKGIVFASYNYRLSLFGYPHALEIAQAGETQNFGLLDTRAAVEWVRDNVAKFGGDPKKITLGGESVGAEMTNQYLSAYPKDPIIRGAIMQSGDSTYLSDIAQYSKSNNLNFPFSNLSALESIYPVPSPEFPTAYNASAAMWRDAHMLCLASNLAYWRTTALNLPIWRYRFDLVADNLNSRGSRIGAFHGTDIRFVMGTWRTIVLSPPFVEATKEQVEISDLMVEGWTNFIKDPHLGPRIPGWRRFDPKDTETLALLGTSTRGAVAGNHHEVDRSCAYWNTILPIFPQTFPSCGSWTC
ncbi:hypothetical protein AAF712_011917 [Marasmius tenuissimus]|uniref:Carboxylesterase type B domain-containing protein n=1 Tax=Marasmius tenuissimus TaxID=585030 RepID=A0ABR2ZJW3_9AGAR